MSEEYKRKSVMQEGEDAPVIEDRKKRRMDEAKIRPRRIEGKTAYMAEEPEAEEAMAYDAGEMDLMPPVPDEAELAYEPVGPLPPMQEKAPEAVEEEAEVERYVRLRLGVRGDQISVLGARTVEGPLVRPEKLHAGLAYEVARDQKQLTLGSIPDVGERRSFPDPDQPEGTKGHHIAELPSYEFQVRIPQQEFSEWALPRLRVSVYRIKGEVPERPTTYEALADQYSEELRPVAELKGIRLQDLADDLQEEVRSALRPK